MLTRVERRAFYRLSTALGVETYLLGCGPARFFPKQRGSGGYVATVKGDLAMSEWTIHCIENQDQRPWWMHTHPGFKAFFSGTDVRGAHSLFENVGRAYDAFVLGEDDETHHAVIDEAWVAAHPKPKYEVMHFSRPPWQPGGYGHSYPWEGSAYREWEWDEPESTYNNNTRGAFGRTNPHFTQGADGVWVPREEGNEQLDLIATESATGRPLSQRERENMLKQVMANLVVSWGTGAVLDALVNADKKARREVEKQSREARRLAIRVVREELKVVGGERKSDPLSRKVREQAIERVTITDLRGRRCPVCQSEMPTPYSCGRCDYSVIGTG